MLKMENRVIYEFDNKTEERIYIKLTLAEFGKSLNNGKTLIHAIIQNVWGDRKDIENTIRIL